MKSTVKNLEEMQNLASDFVENLSPKENSATIVALSGDLGAGKTTFSQGVAKSLGVEENVVSPTFVIMKIYEIENINFNHLIHIDAYRLEKKEELLNLGWQKIISDPKNLILIEWPERVGELIEEAGQNVIKINLQHMADSKEESTERQIEIVL
jgi:tRNA threonylcarbamoyladenosine biosynthesis protein TsaE